jgi:hypothetical protein
MSNKLRHAVRPKDCQVCGKPLIRRTDALGRTVEGVSEYERRRFCGHRCAALGRVAGLQAPPDEASTDSTCFSCGGRDGLLYRHINRDFSDNRPENLALICHPCRMRELCGHGNAAGPCP